MSTEELIQHAERRVAQAKKICAKLTEFKVCTQCLSIAFKRSGTCPICKAYRFSEDPFVVEFVAKYSTNFIFPVTSATVPRLK